MAPPSENVRLQVLVRKNARNERGIAAAEAALRALGFEITGTGRATLSVRTTPETLRALFGDERRDLAVPEPLADYVESMSVAPRHTIISRRRP